MNCKQCGGALPDQVSFCPWCGSAVEQAQPVFCVHCGQALSQDAALCPNCGSDPRQNAPKKKSRKGLIVLAVVLLLLAAVSALCVCTNFFGFYGPGTQMMLAANKTFGSGSFTADMQVNMKYDIFFQTVQSETYGTVQVNVDYENRRILLYAELENENSALECGIYDDYLLISGDGFCRKQDISQALDNFFDSCESGEKADWQQLMKDIDDALGTDIADSIDFEIFEKCLTAYGRNWNSDAWLEENVGYSCEKQDGLTLHTLAPQNYSFLSASLACFETAFKDRNDYDDLCERFKDSKSQLNKMDAQLSLGIRRRAVETARMELDLSGLSLEGAFTFSDIGTTQVDEAYLQELLDKAQ